MAADANRGITGGDLWIRLTAIGLIAGAFSALFGVGGGVVIVPLLLVLLAYDPTRATATSLAAIIITASVAAASHAALDNVRWEEALLIGLPAMAGVSSGIALKKRLSSKALTLAFAAFLGVIAVRIAIGGGSEVIQTGGAEIVLVIALGVVAGIVAGLFGVGGGTVFVPALVLVLGMDQLEAEATSLAAIVPVSLLGTWQQSRSGLVMWRDALAIGGISTITAVLGTLVADVSPERVLQIGFAGLLLFTAFTLVQRALRPSPS